MSPYTLAQRRAHAEQALLLAAEGGWLQLTSCTHIGRTYGVNVAELKAMKGRLFPEFACNVESGK